jgi:hypothetical protein
VLPRALHQEVELCGTREPSSKDSWELPLPRRLGEGDFVELLEGDC